MTHAVRFVAVVAVLTALALCVPVQAQTPETDALRARAEAGDAEAQVSLGFMYLGAQDDAEAVRWYRLAADQGHADAQYNLGGKYAYGVGVPQDLVAAHMWDNLAASRLNAERRDLAVGGRDDVADLMNSTQIAEAQRLAHEWGHAHPREP